MFDAVKKAKIKFLEVIRMSEMLMVDVCKKFASARELCPGMSEEVYALSDYLSAVANDQLVPTGILIMLLCTMDDLEKKRCGFAHKTEFPEYLATHNMQVRAQMPYILQVIDAIAEPDFADAVRTECAEALHWNVPKRVAVSGEISKCGYINAAVNWWSEAIQHPKMDNGDDGLAMIMMMFGGSNKRQLTESELQTFREALTTGITDQMNHAERITLSVDYGPDRILGEAGYAIGLGQFDFPCKTTMWISETEVSVRAGYGAPEQVIWSANAD